MAIDTLTEDLITLAEAAASLPSRRAGRPANLSTMYRWTQSGCRGVRLEYVQVGATRCTSREALWAFVALTAQSRGEPAPVRTPAQRQRAIDAAERELEQAGL